MSASRVFGAAAAIALLALLTVGLVEISSRTSARPSARQLTLEQMRARLAGSPAPLDSLHAQAGQLLSGGLPAVSTRLHALRGMPVVINKWASWCAPCRAEFGAFAQASVSLGSRVAFVGIDSGESGRTAGTSFLRAHPVAYPSYYDPSGDAGSAITDSSFTPVTVFYDSRGSQYIHQGPYTTVAELERDVRRYALDGASA
jgi:thiol-disulfide isomerase/thioredoxin